MKIGLVILNKNEQDALPVILPQIDRQAVEYVVCVDGNSTDRSRDILAEHDIPVLAQPSPGRGEAFRIAFTEAPEGTDAIIFFSPDGNEDPADIGRFRSFLEGGADMVIASRMMKGAVNEEDASWWRPRKWANLAFDWLAWLTWGVWRRQYRIRDAINGYRAITTEAWGRLRADGEGHTIEYQTSIRAYKQRMKVVEFPTVEGQRIGGEIKAKSLITGWRFIKLYFRELFRR